MVTHLIDLFTLGDGHFSNIYYSPITYTVVIDIRLSRQNESKNNVFFGEG